jgi:hypothetical protein
MKKSYYFYFSKKEYYDKMFKNQQNQPNQPSNQKSQNPFNERVTGMIIIYPTLAVHIKFSLMKIAILKGLS